MVSLFGFDPKDKGPIPLPSAIWESRLVAIAGAVNPLPSGCVGSSPNSPTIQKLEKIKIF